MRLLPLAGARVRAQFLLLLVIVGMMCVGLSGFPQAALLPRVVLGHVDSESFPYSVSVTIIDESERRLEHVASRALRVSIDGKALPWSPNPLGRRQPWFTVTGKKAEKGRAVILAFDTSASVPAEDFSQAVRVAKGLLASLSDRDQVLLMSFGRLVARRAGFTRDKAAIASEIDRLQANQIGTFFYDATFDALDALSVVSDADRSLVIFGDGQDERSGTPFDVCLRKAEEAGIPVSTVAIGTPGPGHERMRRLAASSGGASYSLDGGEDPERLGRALIRAGPHTQTLLFNHPDLAAGGPFKLAVGLTTQAGVLVAAERTASAPGPGRLRLTLETLGKWLALPLLSAVLLLGALIAWRCARTKRNPVHETFLRLKDEAHRLQETVERFYPELESYGFAATDEIRERQRAHLEAFEQFLRVLENVRELRAAGASPPKRETTAEFIYGDMEDALRRLGVRRIEPQVGTEADPRSHQLPSGARPQGGRIAQVLEAGYVLRRQFGGVPEEHVLRRAIVRLENETPAVAEPNPEDATKSGGAK